MNRGLTGLLAWSALALVIAVPSAEILLTQPNEVANEVASESKVFIGPPVAEGPQVLADSQIAAPDLPVSVASADDVLPFQPDAAPLRVVLPAHSKALPLPTIVPAGAPKVAVVADDVLVLPKEPSLESENISAPAVATALVDKSDATPLPQAEPEYVGAESLIVANAPVPMPASLRPRQTVVANAVRQPLPQLEQDVSQSIATVRTTVRTPPQLYGDVIVEENSDFWGDDPRYRGRGNLQAFGTDSAADSKFFELWEAENRPSGFQRRGSFEEQLPERRGSSVRLDLLQ